MSSSDKVNGCQWFCVAYCWLPLSDHEEAGGAYNHPFLPAIPPQPDRIAELKQLVSKYKLQFDQDWNDLHARIAALESKVAPENTRCMVTAIFVSESESRQCVLYSGHNAEHDFGPIPAPAPQPVGEAVTPEFKEALWLLKNVYAFTNPLQQVSIGSFLERFRHVNVSVYSEATAPPTSVADAQGGVEIGFHCAGCGKWFAETPHAPTTPEPRRWVGLVYDYAIWTEPAYVEKYKSNKGEKLVEVIDYAAVKDRLAQAEKLQAESDAFGRMLDSICEKHRQGQHPEEWASASLRCGQCFRELETQAEKDRSAVERVERLFRHRQARYEIVGMKELRLALAGSDEGKR